MDSDQEVVNKELSLYPDESLLPNVSPEGFLPGFGYLVPDRFQVSGSRQVLARLSSKVDRFVPRSQRDNLSIV